MPEGKVINVSLFVPQDSSYAAIELFADEVRAAFLKEAGKLYAEARRGRE